jgi:hypothetical protein
MHIPRSRVSLRLLVVEDHAGTLRVWAPPVDLPSTGKVEQFWVLLRFTRLTITSPIGKPSHLLERVAALFVVRSSALKMRAHAAWAVFQYRRSAQFYSPDVDSSTTDARHSLSSLETRHFLMCVRQ